MVFSCGTGVWSVVGCPAKRVVCELECDRDLFVEADPRWSRDSWSASDVEPVCFMLAVTVNPSHGNIVQLFDLEMAPAMAATALPRVG
jgi:hypothetical protein